MSNVKPLSNAKAANASSAAPPASDHQRSGRRCATRPLGRAQHAARRHLCALSEEQEFPLAHVGPHFRDYHLLLDEHATRSMQSPMRLRAVRKLAARHPLHGHIARLQRLADNDADS